MRWADVTKRPDPKMLRQFAGLWLLFFLGLAAWRAWDGQFDTWAGMLVAIGVSVGTLGLWRPASVRYLFTGWMIAAFPIGWAISRLMIGLLFVAVFTPVALIFRAIGRDALRLRRKESRSYWMTKTTASSTEYYFRQF